MDLYRSICDKQGVEEDRTGLEKIRFEEQNVEKRRM
jgi:hypothetical protein